jgi:hypothetical protein
MRPIGGFGVAEQGKRAVNVGVMADKVRGKAVSIEVVDIGASGHFSPLAGPPRGPLQRAIGKEPGSCR